MNLVAFVGSDKENIGQVAALVNRMECEKIIIIKKTGTDAVPQNDRTEIIEIDTSQSIAELKKQLQEKLKKSLSNDFEVALSMASGNGKEHMALLSALLNIPVGVRLVAYTKKGVEFLS